jgi:imidazolonepropionase-like amidohydrolase
MRSAFRKSALMVFVAVLGKVFLAAGESPSQVAIRAGTLFDGTSGRMLSDQVIIVTGDRIAQVGSRESVTMPAGVAVIDLSRATVLPGLLDCHTHVFEHANRWPQYADYDAEIREQSASYRTLQAMVDAQHDLESGFTTIRDMETMGAPYSDVDLRKAIDRGLVPGPRMQVATNGIAVTGGYYPAGFDYPFGEELPHTIDFVDSAQEARKAVRTQIMYGADVIKLYSMWGWGFEPDGRPWYRPGPTLEETQAVIDEAHREGKKVGCHAYGGEGLRTCVDAGIDSVEHGIDLDAATIAEMVKKGTYLVPTAYLYFIQQESDLKRSNGKNSRMRIQQESFPRALAAGVKIAFGTGVGPFPHGTQAKEFGLLVAMGMSPSAALLSSTNVCPQLMGWQDRVGSVEPGKFADIIAVDGNPLTDISVLERVKFVMKGGAIIRNDLK